MADEDDGRAGGLAKRISAWALPRTCVTVPGADSTVSVHMVWIESMMASAGRWPCEGGDDVLHVGLEASSTGAWPRPRRSALQADLRHRLFAGNVGHPLASLGQGRRGLYEESRLADAGIAAEQDDGAMHEAAAGHPVEFGDARRRARASFVSPASPSSGKIRPLARDGRVATGPTMGLAEPVSSAMVFQPPQASHLPFQRL